MPNPPEAAEPAPLRADAARNLVKVLAAAREIFIDQGERAQIEDIARRAGVGVGTVYRRFGNKQGLIEAVLVQGLAEIHREVQEIEREPDSMAALVRAMGVILNHARKDRYLMYMLAERAQARMPPEESREAVETVLGRLFLRAQLDGAVRADVAFTDVLALLRGLVGSTVTRHGPACADGGLAILVRGISSDR